MVDSARGHRSGVLEKSDESANPSSLSTAAVAATLQQIFGQKLTAFMAGTDDLKDVDRWARGETRPSPDAALAFDEGFQGIVYHSRFEASLSCWAIFEGTSLKRQEVMRIAPDDPDFLAVAQLFGLHLHGLTLTRRSSIGHGILGCRERTRRLVMSYTKAETERSPG